MNDWAPGRESEFNPYQAPAAEVGDLAPSRDAASGVPTPSLLEKLGGTAPWVLFLAIMGFIGAAFMLLSGLSSLVMVPLLNSLEQPLPNSGGVGMFIGLSLFYVVGGGVYAVLAYLLVRYYQKISTATRERSFESVEEALGVQATFWRVTGITTIVMLLLSIVFTISMFIFAAALGVENSF